MTLQTLPGDSLYYPARPLFNTGNLGASVIDATGEKFAWVGRVWNKARTTKDIRKVGFRFGTVTKAGGSALTVSLQNINLAATPHQPDETQDQTVAIANADAGFISSAWYQTGAFSANRTVAFGEQLAVVVEYDGAGRLSSDTVALTNMNATFIDGEMHSSACVLKTASWAIAGVRPNLVLEFSDGTFGCLQGSFISSISLANLAFNLNTAGSDEYALEFQVPFPCKVDGMWLIGGSGAATGDFDIVLYSGTTPLETVSYEGNNITSNNSRKYIEIPFANVISLSANTLYRLAMKPTQATSNVLLAYFDVAAAGHFQAHDGGEAMCLGSRIDAGAWAGATTTRRPFMGLRISALDDGAGGGAGGASIFGGGLVV